MSYSFDTEFIRSGIRDDVAQQVSTSKKYLHRYFNNKDRPDNKDERVTGVLGLYIVIVLKKFESTEKYFKNITDVLIPVMKRIRRHLSKMDISLLVYLQSQHIAVWNLYLEFKNVRTRDLSQSNRIRAKKEGYFCKEIDLKMLSIFRVEQVPPAFSNKLLRTNKLNFREAKLQVLYSFVHDLFTLKEMLLTRTTYKYNLTNQYLTT